MLRTPLKVDWQTMHTVPKKGIQTRPKTGKSCSFLEVKVFSSVFVLTFHPKRGKNLGFPEVNIYFS